MNTNETSTASHQEDNPMNAQHMPIMNIRMSRISHPRANWLAIVLLVVVFLGFGIWAEASLPETQSAAPLLESSLAANIPWLGKLSAAL